MRPPPKAHRMTVDAPEKSGSQERAREITPAIALSQRPSKSLRSLDRVLELEPLQRRNRNRLTRTEKGKGPATTGPLVSAAPPVPERDTEVDSVFEAYDARD